jgi:N5-(cytidine 5'-diphosphoramidyl)-L-glutamine hydrolase
MKLIAITQRVDICEQYDECRDALDQRISSFVMEGGYLPCPVPNAISNSEANSNFLNLWLETICPAGIILSGGNDIGDRPERDATERQLIEYAAEQSLPVLGICRGMQMLAHWAKTPLIPISGHVATRHRINGAVEGETNSFHRLALAACPTGFQVLATSSDGSIEAIRHESLPWEGWMWHPEREQHLNTDDVLRLKALFK